MVVHTNPTASISGDNSVCQGGSVTFTASGGTTYLWSTGSLTTPVITVSNNTPVTVTVTDANGCTDTAEKTLLVHSNPTATISGDNSVCDGGSVTFTASGGNTYVWSTGPGTPSITVSNNTPVSVTVTDANGCTDTAEKTLTIHPNPTASISGDNSVCDGGSVTFTANGGVTYVWSTGPATPSITVSNNTPVTVTVTDANGCKDTAEKTLLVHPVPDAGGDLSINCFATDVATLQATGTGTWTLVPGPGTATIAVTTNPNTTVSGFSAPGTYEFIWSNGFCEDRVQITVGNTCDCPTGDNNITGPAVTEVCQSFPATTITGNNATPAGGTYVWEMEINGGGFVAAPGTNNQKDYTTPVFNPGLYRIKRVYNVFANGKDCEYESNIITIEVFTNPIASISGDNSVCSGGSVTFTASGGGTYDWSTGGPSTTSITVSNNTPVTVTVTDANGCTDTAEKTLIVHSNPTAIISGDDDVCQGGSVTFTASGGNSYIWSNGGLTTPGITVSNNTPVTVTVTDANGCTDTAEKTLTVHSNPTASISGDDSVCDGGSVIFTAAGGVDYEWSTMETTQSITVSTGGPTRVTVTDANGCTDTAEKTLTIHPVPDAGPDVSLNCYITDAAVLNAVGSGVWSYGTGPGTPNIVNVNQSNAIVNGFPAAGVYEMYWSNGLCEDIMTITVGDICDCPAGNNNITALADAEVCFEFPQTIIVGNDATPAGGNYTWEISVNGSSFIDAPGLNNSKNYTTNILPEGNYSFRRIYRVFANGQDCVYESDPVSITVFPNPVASISGDDAVCEGQTTVFTADGGVTYNWGSGANTISITVTDNSPQFVTVTDINGCTATAEKSLSFYPNPFVTISRDNSACEGSGVTFTAQGGLLYNWNTTDNSQSIVVFDDITKVVTVTDGNGCTATAEKTLTINSNPVASINGDDSVCDGGSVTFTADGGTSYLWNTLDVTQSINVTDGLTKFVTVTDGNGCTATAEKTLTIHPVPDAGPDVIINCYIDGSINMNASGSGTWSYNTTTGNATITNTNDPNTTISGFSNAGVYQFYWSNNFCEDIVIVNVGDNCDCPTGDNQITVPTVTEICNEYPSTLIEGNNGTPAGGTYLWYINTNNTGFVSAGGVNNTKDFTTGILSVGDYQFRRVYTVQANGQDCIYESNPVAITVFENPTAVITGDNAICEGESTTFTASGGVSYNWGGSIVTDIITVSDNTERTVIVTDANGCTDSASKTLVVNANPTAVINGENEVGEGESATFTANGGTTYLWSNGVTTQSITVSNNIPVDVTVTDVNGCSDNTSKTLTIHDNPVASISGDENICEGESTLFPAEGGLSYSWNTNQNIQSITVSDELTKTVTVTDSNGCTATAEKSLNIHPVPDAGPDLSVNCYISDSVILNGDGSGTWAFGVRPGDPVISNINDPNAVVSGFPAPGSYQLYYSGAYCEDEVMITVGDNCDCPTGDNQIFAPALAEICNEYPATLIGGNDATPAGGTYVWQMNTNNTVFVSATGINNTKDYTTAVLPVGQYIIRRVYTVQVNGQECVYESNPVSFTVHNNPTAQITGDDEICDGESTTFTANGGASYNWGPSQNNQSITVSTANTFTVTVTDVNNCTDTESITLTVQNNPTAQITGDDEICDGESTTFTANGGSTYNWGPNGSAQDITVSTANTFTVTVTDANNCTDTESITLTVHNNPTAQITGDDEICDGESTTFTANGGSSYNWGPNGSAQDITVSTANTFTVTVTDVNNCTDTESITLTVHNNPTAQITGDDEICEGESTTFTASGGSTYNWGPSQNNQSITVSTANTFTVTVTDANNCSDTESITLIVNPQPDAGPEMTANCYVSDNVAMNASGTGTWSFGTTAGTASISNVNNANAVLSGFTAPGQYEMIWTNGNCEDRVMITVNNNCDCPTGDNQIFAPALAEICNEYPATLIGGNDGTPAGGTYIWQMNTNSAGFVTATGINNTKDYTTAVLPVGQYIIRRVYTVQVNGQDCVYESNPVSITVHANPVASISGDDEVCEGENATFTANGGVSYLWSNGQTTESIIVSNNTPVDVIVTDANGCTDSASKTLVVNANPTAVISGDDEICEGENAIFTASGGTSYNWGGSIITDNITVSNNTERTVIVTDANGCTDSASKTLTINTNPVASITGDDEICDGESTTFTANGGIAYNWTSGNNQSITVSTANTYTVTVTDSNNCSDTESITLIVNPQPDAGPDMTANCYVSDNVAMNASGTGTWSFGTTAGTASISNVNNANAVLSGFTAPGQYEMIWTNGNCEDRVMITVNNNCDCPTGDNQIFAPALAEICNEYPATLIGGNDATPAGGTYVWQLNTNSGGFMSAGGVNNTKDYTTAVLPVGQYIIRRVYTVQVNGQDCVYESNPVSITVHANPSSTYIRR
ncbi:MAG: hypothetical protein IPK25_08845 [Saprospiraceae bacterium]|nr:hypothetical protein [Saprospiraceae bacterium]